MENDLRNRLVNWARWSRDRPVTHRAFSVEGRFRPEILRGDEEEERRHASHPVDIRDALLVYRAIVPPAFPREFAFALAGEFIFRFEPRIFIGYLRRHGIRVRDRDLHQHVADAVFAAKAAIKRAENRGLTIRSAQDYSARISADSRVSVRLDTGIPRVSASAIKTDPLACGSYLL